MTEAKRIYLRELAIELDRRMNTIRLWEQPERDPKTKERTGPIPLPVALRGHRDERGWRYWTPAQVKRIKTWMQNEGRAPGVGLRNVTPSVEKTAEMLKNLRAPRPERRTRA